MEPVQKRILIYFFSDYSVPTSRNKLDTITLRKPGYFYSYSTGHGRENKAKLKGP
jgi:hypothetical protein